jgi:membrane protease YdiL (CAAX protease family)
LAQSDSDRRLPGLSLTAAALWAVALWLLKQICIETTDSLRAGAITDVVSIATCEALATSIIVFAMMRVHAPEGSLRAALGVRPIGPVRFALSAAAGAGLFPALAAIDDLVARRWPYDDPEALAGMDKMLASASHTGLVVGIFVIVPLAHELFFRGMLFTQVRATATAMVTVLATSILFMTFPLEPRVMPTLLLLSLALALLRERTGTVIAPIVAHLAFGAVEGVPILRGADPEADVTYSLRWIVGGAAIAIVSLAIVGLMGPRTEPGRT